MNDHSDGLSQWIIDCYVTYSSMLAVKHFALRFMHIDKRLSALNRIVYAFFADIHMCGKLYICGNAVFIY